MYCICFSMKLKLIFVVLLLIIGRIAGAQYVNTDSLMIIPGFESPFTLHKAEIMELNFSGPDYVKNLRGGELLLQFLIPADGKVISHFGIRSGRMHTGTDIKMQKGDTIYAAYNGSVSHAHYYYGYGNLVVIQHEKNIETYYGHLSKFLVKPGEWIRKGEPLGLAGATGRATTSHLHFEIRENDEPYNPELVFDFENGWIHRNIEHVEYLADLKKKNGNDSSTNDYSVNKSLSQKYIVRSGDSLYKISRRAKTSVQALCRLNQLTESSVLQVGQVLTLF